jgi:CBS domain-containing protein
MELEKIMTPDVASINPDSTMLDAAKLMTRRNISSLLVVENEVIIGILSERDFLYLLMEGRNPEKLKVSKIMSSPVITAEKNTILEDALNLMHYEGILKLPITDKGKLAGIITETEVVNALRNNYKTIEPTIEEKLDDKPLTHDLKFSNVYLCLEPKPERSLELFREFVKHGIPGLCITRQNPTEIKEIHEFEKTPVIWITNTPTHENHIAPHNLQGLAIIIGEYMSKAEKSIVLLDGISYLITQNNFETILHLIQNIRDKTVQSNAILLLSQNPKTLTEIEIELIKQETDEIL